MTERCESWCNGDGAQAPDWCQRFLLMPLWFSFVIGIFVTDSWSISRCPPVEHSRMDHNFLFLTNSRRILLVTPSHFYFFLYLLRVLCEDFRDRADPCSYRPISNLPCMVSSRVVSPEISGNLFQSFRKLLFPENFTKNTVHTFEIAVYLFTSSLSIGCYRTPVAPL